MEPLLIFQDPSALFLRNGRPFCISSDKMTSLRESARVSLCTEELNAYDAATFSPTSPAEAVILLLDLCKPVAASSVKQR